MRQCYNDWSEIHWILDGKCSQTWCPNHICPAQIKKSFDQNCAPHYEWNIKDGQGEIDCAGSDTETVTNPTGKIITNASRRSIKEVIKNTRYTACSPLVLSITSMCCECSTLCHFVILSYCTWSRYSARSFISSSAHSVQMANGKWTWLAVPKGGSAQAQS